MTPTELHKACDSVFRHSHRQAWGTNPLDVLQVLTTSSILLIATNADPVMRWDVACAVIEALTNAFGEPPNATRH